MSKLFFTITSSNGDWKAHKNGGQVVNQQDGYPLSDNKKVTLVKFDVAEYKKHYKVDDMPDSLDILDIGYHYRESENAGLKYEEPAHDWRKEVKILRIQK